MENEILKQWQRDYPSIPADVLAKLAGFLETVCGGDAARRSELVTASADAMAILSERFSASAQAEAQVAEYEQGRATQAEFVQALSKELTDRGVPEVSGRRRSRWIPSRARWCLRPMRSRRGTRRTCSNRPMKRWRSSRVRSRRLRRRRCRRRWRITCGRCAAIRPWRGNSRADLPGQTAFRREKTMMWIFV